MYFPRKIEPPRRHRRRYIMRKVAMSMAALAAFVVVCMVEGWLASILQDHLSAVIILLAMVLIVLSFFLPARRGKR